MRSGASSSSSASLDLLQRLVAGGQVAGALGLVQRPAPARRCGATVSCSVFLSPRCGTRICTRLPRSSLSSASKVVDVGRQRGHQDLARHRLGVAGVELEQEVLDQLGGVAVVDPVGHPAALAADPAAADVEDLHGDLERVLGERDHVGVGAVAEHDRLLLQRPVQGAEVVAQPRGPLEVQRVGGGVHLLLDAPDERAGLAGHEVAEVVDDRAVLLGAHLARRTAPSTCRCSRAGTAGRSARTA